MKKYIYIILLFSISTPAQNLDSLYNVLMSSSGKIKYPLSPSQIENKQPDKCGFGLAANIKTHMHEFSIEQQQTISEVMQRPELSTSLVSPSGLFRIHYDESGNHAPAYNINDLAEAFDSAYNYEVNFLGYPAPPKDGTLGGDDKYDIYVRNLNGGLYGATTPETTIGEGKYISYIEIDNSFGENEGYNSYGINAARVTAAHEFHHAIQIGNYIFRTEDAFYYELTSTAFEEFVYDEVNDYYAYMWSFFRNTSNKFEDSKGYNLAIWNIFLSERFKDENPMLGHQIIKKSWEYMANNRAMVSIAKAMSFYNKSFANEFNVFADWLYFTDINSKENKYFEESGNYPMVKSNYTFELDNSEKTLMVQSKPTSINYLTYTDYTQGFADTVVAILSNSDVYGSTEDNNVLDIDFTIANSSFAGANQINEIYYYKISGESPEFIQASYIINNELASNIGQRSEIDFAYPQPFNYETNDILNFPTYPDLSNTAELNIYSPDMNLVYSGTVTISSNDNIVVKWDGKDNIGNNLASGVYVYVTRANNKIKKGKFVILN